MIATSFLLAASLLHQACFANKFLSITTIKSMRKLSGTRGGSQNHQGGGGHHGGGSNGHQGGDRPFSGGPNLDCPGFPGDRFEPETATVACDLAYDCELRGNGEAGSFVCRTMFHPITGENNTKAMCIPNDKAWTTDNCGCCGGDCPEQPDFIDELLDCEEEPDQDIEFSRARIPGGGDVDLTVVCRKVTNPFTGEHMSVTLPVPEDRGLEGDVCGCCGGVCPERGELNFPRPDLVDITWDADDLVMCDLRPKRGQDNTRQGLFLCRELFNPRTGVSKQEALCIPGDRAWETDACGCCGGDCPTQPVPVDIECTDTADACELRNGEDGVFVCRALFHPVDGEIRERSMCIPSDRAWVTDACSCCEESGCPTTPEGGFDDEDTQLMTLALETYVFLEETESGASSVAVLGGCSVAFVALMALVI